MWNLQSRHLKWDGGSTIFNICQVVSAFIEIINHNNDIGYKILLQNDVILWIEKINVNTGVHCFLKATGAHFYLSYNEQKIWHYASLYQFCISSLYL